MTKELKKFTLTSIKNIPNAIENNNFVIFVGDGVSRNSGLSTWSEVIKELAKNLEIKAKGKYSNKNDIFSNFKGKLSLKGLVLYLYKFLFFIKIYQHFDVNKYYSITKQLESFDVTTYTILNKVFSTNIEQRLCFGGASFSLEKKQDTF